MTRPAPISSTALERTLVAAAKHLSTGAVITDLEIREAYASDASEAPSCVPGAVVRPKNTTEVAHLIRAANEHQVPLVPRAAGTNRVGSATPVTGSIVLSTEKMIGVDVDQADQIARVHPAQTTESLHHAAEAEGLFYPPDPNSLATCTIGGNVATNAGGPRAFGYGVTGRYVLGMTVVSGAGEILRIGRATRKGVTGYDLVSLMVGSEGTLGVVTEITLQLLPRRASTAALLVLFDGEAKVEEAITTLRRQGVRLVSAELLDAHVLSLVRTRLPVSERDAKAALLCEIDAERSNLDTQLELAGNLLDGAGALSVSVALSKTEREQLWAPRRDVSNQLRTLRAHKLSEDVVVPTSQLADLLRFTRDQAEALQTPMPTYGHAGDGNMHVNFLWDTPEERLRVDRGIDALFRKVIDLGGTLSGEHGIGVMKAKYLPLEQSREVIAVQERIKSAFDPKGILNPGKLFPSEAKRYHGIC